MIGETISHYRIVEKIGEGGMGKVYVAEDTLLGRRVAIKTLTIKPGQDEQHFRTRFLREARAVSALSHPHIATIHDYGETKDGSPYIVMEFVKGRTLGDLMLAESLTIQRALEIIQQVAEALSEAHHNGVIHRDIKPSNVAINHRGEVKVLDFGLAKQLNIDSLSSTDPERQTLLTSQTQEGVIVGTPMYLSPEQALGGNIDARSDLFSLGALLYECVAGRPPFEGSTRMEICTKVIRDDPPPPSQHNSDVSPKLDQIVLKSLAKKPDDRYQTADEMASALRDVLASLDVSGLDRRVTRLVSPEGARPTGALGTLSDIFRRPRISLGYVVAGILLLTILGLVIWRLTRATAYEPKAESKHLYDLAVDALREGMFFKSSKLLQQAVNDDPRFALAHARLAETWMELDFSDRAKDELIRAGDLVPNRSVLAETDAIRLQGITDTVKRDFAAAVEDYRQLAAKAPAAEQAYAYVDLGRAYEKNEQWDKAIESYQESIKRKEYYAAAYLRLGVALRHNQKYAAAEAAFAEADRFFHVSNEIEGITEVLFQRGLMFSQQGKIADSRAQLEQALERSIALENTDQRIRTLQQLSTTAILEGNADAARKHSQQAMELAQANNMENLTTSGLIDIGSSYLIKGNFGEAEKNFSEALRLAQLNKGKQNEARALLALASLRKQQDDPDAARDYAQRALTFYQQGSYGKQTFLALTILGHAYDEGGDYQSAEKTFQQLLQAAQQVDDSRSVAFAHEGLGYVFLNTGRFSEALTHFAEEYRIAKDNNAKLMLGYAADYRGSASWRLGRYEAGIADVNEATTIADPSGTEPYKDLLADVTWSAASLALSQRKFPESANKAEKALKLASTEYKNTAVRAGSTLGLARSLSGQAVEGRKHCEEAVRLARMLRNPLPLSEALLGLAETAFNAGDAQVAINAAAEAQQRFTAANQHEAEWRAYAIEARAAAKLGDKDRARQLAAQSANILAGLEQTFGGDNYKSYLARPDIQGLHVEVAALAHP